MPPQIDPEGPYRKWYNKEPLLFYNVFLESDIVWWTQSDLAYPPPPPGNGINEDLSEWSYTPWEQGDPRLVVQYITYDNRRYAKFIFPASFLNDGAYQITCNIVNNAGETYLGAWDVTVMNI